MLLAVCTLRSNDDNGATSLGLESDAEWFHTVYSSGKLVFIGMDTLLQLITLRSLLPPTSHIDAPDLPLASVAARDR